MGPDAMILVFECWVLSQFFHFPLSPSARGFLVPLHFLSLEWFLCLGNIPLCMYIYKHFHQHCTIISFSPHPFQYLLSVHFLKITILTRVSWYHIIALRYFLCWSVMLSVFSCVCPLTISPLEKKCIQVFLSFFFNQVFFLILSYIKSSSILYQSLVSHVINKYFPKLQIFFSFGWWFPLLYKSF